MNFSARLLGSRQLDVQLESALKSFPRTDQCRTVACKRRGEVKWRRSEWLRPPASGCIRGALAGLREIPVNQLPDRTEEILAYTAEQPDWRLAHPPASVLPRGSWPTYSTSSPSAHGLVGACSATIRYGLMNQGVQEFKIKVPANCKNIEFTGPNIRRKEQAGDIWTIGLQDKVWTAATRSWLPTIFQF